MRSSDLRARSKMKARRLIIEEDSSPESRSTVRKECPSQEARPAEKAVKEKEELIRKKLYSVEYRSTSVEQSQASRRDKGKAILAEYVPLKRRDVPVESTRREELQDQDAEVLTVSSNTEEDPDALEEVAAKAVEDVAAAESEPQKVISPWTSTDTIILEKSEEPSAEETQSPTLGAADVLSVECGKLRTQRSQAEEQLCEVEAKLTEAKGKNWQLSEETREALTPRVERCLRGSRDKVVNLEVELANVLKRLNLEQRLEGAATADSRGVGLVWCSHRSR
ncbi:hypothetical protein AXG93_2637s1100 [Marchantia polymorpha subsp. ruderalis]|uniref:Uncharacterized protein n=1 Tax=Marchantia polymorpha subsp. ruderalis TaxID=1480154 RepID=A0A176VF37_MARPO|nr:hypothetical protein AXG93_2637s1100 [Marchantia polymorpha subsp. ruderalis]